MDINKLLKALDNDNNENLMNYTTKKLKEINFNILKELYLSHEETIYLYNKLKNYKYIDELDNLKYGTYLRWISLKNPDVINLKKGAIFCNTKITDDGIFLLCKNHGFNSKHFQIKFDENLIFQKLTDQELILLNALDHLSK